MLPGLCPASPPLSFCGLPTLHLLHFLHVRQQGDTCWVFLQVHIHPPSTDGRQDCHIRLCRLSTAQPMDMPFILQSLAEKRRYQGCLVEHRKHLMLSQCILLWASRVTLCTTILKEGGIQKISILILKWWALPMKTLGNIFFCPSHAAQHVGSQLPHQALNLGPGIRKLRVLTTGPPEQSLEVSLKSNTWGEFSHKLHEDKWKILITKPVTV